VKALVFQIIKKAPFYYRLRNWRSRTRQNAELTAWEQNGKPVPPPHIVKQRTLREYSKEYDLRILVETGTYLGDMIEAVKDDFDRIYSIELSRSLYENALIRFKRAHDVELIHGDSARELERLLSALSQPALFWLDCHYSGGGTAKGEKDTPVFEEVSHILNSKDLGHVIIIDDARCFGNDPAYPSIEDLSSFVRSRRSNVSIAVQDDSIRITPRRESNHAV